MGNHGSHNFDNLKCQKLRFVRSGDNVCCICPLWIGYRDMFCPNIESLVWRVPVWFGVMCFARARVILAILPNVEYLVNMCMMWVCIFLYCRQIEISLLIAPVKAYAKNCQSLLLDSHKCIKCRIWMNRAFWFLFPRGLSTFGGNRQFLFRIKYHPLIPIRQLPPTTPRNQTWVSYASVWPAGPGVSYMRRHSASNWNCGLNAPCCCTRHIV